MSIKLKRSGALASLSMTPLIDVVFLLLIFFLVATRFAEEERDLKIDLPVATEAKPLTARPRDLTVNIDRQGRFFVGLEMVDAVRLEDILRQAAVNNPGRQNVVLRADRNSPSGSMVQVIDLSQRHGIRVDSIRTDN